MERSVQKSRTTVQTPPPVHPRLARSSKLLQCHSFVGINLHTAFRPAEGVTTYTVSNDFTSERDEKPSTGWDK